MVVEAEHKDRARIHIDQQPYESPNPTTGVALYALRNVKPSVELYREVEGNREDKPIPKSKEHIHLKEDEHFHSGEPHKFTIIVNARKKTVNSEEVTFEQIVALAFDPIPPNSIFTVTYSGGMHHQEGTLQVGQKVNIKEGMEFNVTEKLVNHNWDLSQLRAEGYDVEVKLPAHLLVSGIPYVNGDKKVNRGILASELGEVAGDVLVAPKNHVAFLAGECPCNADGSPIAGVSQVNQVIDKDLTLNYQISRKPSLAPYPDFYAKMRTYIDILSGPAKVIDPNSTAKTFPIVVPAEGESVFNYLDTAATKVGIIAANKKLETGKTGIVGLGGTGSYVLDLVAKTPVPEIHLFDRDEFLNHNAFRSPGAPSIEELRGKPKKVTYLKDLYSKMRQHIIAHDCYINEANVELLREMDFVFICIDKGMEKRLIVERLEEWGKPFIDVGMGLQLVDDAILGILTVTTSTAGKRNHLRDRVAFSDGEAENEYSRNVQIADLNSLNATLAVIKWKKLRGYYHDTGKEHFCAYSIANNGMVNEDKA